MIKGHTLGGFERFGKTTRRARHLAEVERNALGKTQLKATNQYLKGNVVKIGSDTIAYATIISVPSSTTNRDKARRPEMHQTAKGRLWYFGMKGHVGVDSRTKFIHTILALALNLADYDALPYLLHGKETRIWGDQAYQGQKNTIRQAVARTRDFTNGRYCWRITIDQRIKACNGRESSVRAKVEHSIDIMKRVFSLQ